MMMENSIFMRTSNEQGKCLNGEEEEAERKRTLDVNSLTKEASCF
jgi:hypothetical protein